MASTEEIRTDLAEIVNDVAGVAAEDVQLDKSFVDDLGVDSLSMVEIIYACEDKFGVSIPDEDSKNLKTVGDAVAYIERAQACFPESHPVPGVQHDRGSHHRFRRSHATWCGRSQHLGGDARRPFRRPYPAL